MRLYKDAPLLLRLLGELIDGRVALAAAAVPSAGLAIAVEGEAWLLVWVRDGGFGEDNLGRSRVVMEEKVSAC